MKLKKYYKQLIAAIIVICSILIFVGIHKKPHADRCNILVVGTDANFAPFEFKKDGELAGFDIDLMEAIAHRIHKKVVWKDIGFTALLLEAQTGQIDVIAAAMSPTPERAQKVDFLPTYLEHDPLIVITLKNTPAPHTLDDLKGKNVIVNDGYTAEAFMQQQKGIPLMRIGSVAEAFLALNAGRGDAFVSAQSATQAYFDQAETEQYDILTLEQNETYALAVAKKQPALYERMKEAYEQLEKDGTIRALKQKWHLIQTPGMVKAAYVRF